MERRPLMATYSYEQLKQLWIANGGSPAAAPMAAAVALAESGGRSDAVNRNTNGTTDDGLWQINKGGAAMHDPNANAKRAVQMSGNGTNWRPWCVAYSDNACGTKGGTYAGPGAGFWKYLTGGAGPSSSPGSTPSTSTSAAAAGDCLWTLPKVSLPGPLPDIGGWCMLTRSQGRALLGAAAIAGGAFVMLAGFAFVLAGSRTGRQLATFVPGVGGAAAGAGSRPAAAASKPPAPTAREARGEPPASTPGVTHAGRRYAGARVVEMDDLAA